jgi:hypothetical protein
MMFKRVVAGLAVIGAVIACAALPASAQYAEPAELSRTGGSGCSAGGDAVFSVTGALPGSDVTFIFQSDPVVLGVATADDSGAATLDTAWPNNASEGEHHVVAQGVDGDGNPFEVTLAADCAPPGGVAPTTLARTGSDSVPWAQAGVLLVVAGGLIVLASRRRTAVVREHV